jgi:hypothetical protein
VTEHQLIELMGITLSKLVAESETELSVVAACDKAIAYPNRTGLYLAKGNVKRDEMNQDSKRDAAANPRMEETAMLWRKSSLDRKERDKRAADVLWWILMVLRFAI